VCFAECDERGRPRLSNLLTVRRLLLDHRFEPIILCDANLKYNIYDGDRPRLEALISRGDVRAVPAGTDADVWVLEAAAQLDARTVSNDRYRQLLGAALATVEADPRPTDGAATPEPVAPIAELDLVQELLTGNAAIRVSRDLLVRECRRSYVVRPHISFYGVFDRARWPAEHAPA
jgi:hypothetical protein